MSDALKYGGPAFPTEPRGPAYGNKYDGMTLRDWFAGQVIASVKAWHPADKRGKSAAVIAYEIADAMLAERQVIRPPHRLTVAAQEDRG